MIKDVFLNSVEGVFVFNLDSQFQAKIIFDSVYPEIISSPSQRSKLEMFLNGSNITVKISAQDSTSFRASLNSSIKWILLSLEVFNLKEEFL